MFGHILVFRNTIKEPQVNFSKVFIYQKHLGSFKHTYTHFDMSILYVQMFWEH